MGMFDWLFGKQEDIDILGDILGNDKKSPEPNPPAKKVDEPKPVIKFNIREFDSGKIYFNSLLNEYYYINQCGIGSSSYSMHNMQKFSGGDRVGTFSDSIAMVFTPNTGYSDILNGLVKVDIKDIPDIYKSYDDKESFRTIILDNTNYITELSNEFNVEGYTLLNNELLQIQRYIEDEGCRWSYSRYSSSFRYLSREYLLNINSESVVDCYVEKNWYLDKILSATPITSTKITKEEYLEKYHYIIEFHHSVIFDEVNRIYLDYINNILNYRNLVNEAFLRNGVDTLPEINNLDKLLLFIEAKDRYTRLVTYTAVDEITISAQFKLFAINYFEKEIGK